MVCNRCVAAVAEMFEALNVKTDKIDLGVVEIAEGNWNPSKIPAIRHNLKALGFELIDDKKSALIEQAKTTIIKHIHHTGHSEQKTNWSDIISEAVDHDYKSLSQLFSSVEGTTIERFIILQKIEKVKELLAYGEHTLSEISWKLGYSSVAHLSNQFKKVTGMSPKYYKEIGEQRRKPLDQI